MGNVESEMLETYQDKFDKIKTNVTILEYQEKNNIKGSAFVSDLNEPVEDVEDINDMENYGKEIYELINGLVENEDESLEKTKLLFEMVKYYMNKFPENNKNFIHNTLIKLRSYN